MTTPENRAQLRTLAQEATPLPWGYRDNAWPEHCVAHDHEIDGGSFDIPNGHGNGECEILTREDAAYIAAACNAVPGLLDEIEVLQAHLTAERDCHILLLDEQAAEMARAERAEAAVARLREALLNEPCDRCAKVAPELHPFTLSETITYRGRVIEKAWLCRTCLVIEKEKWWKANRRKATEQQQ